ncbi:MAG: thioredoxin domain-containing protein [Flavobacteriaceae bacterium]|nr:thioredoxin domain-containing protein [Flavobacteriaceae bacterium]
MYKITILITASLLLLFSCDGQTKKQMSAQQYTNSLIKETSPYLLQHAHNPVNWHAWNDESLALAKKENKLIIISIGYAACHWCHVMEHESFEDTIVAKVMNNSFISIKVDREERPDVDQVYMSAVQLMTGSGGWPLNVIALPDGRPIWGGTYLRKKDWINALNQLAKLYKESPKKAEGYAANLTNGINQNSLVPLNNSKKDFNKIELDKAVSEWQKSLDFKFGGRQGAPKFPIPNNFIFLMQYVSSNNNSKLLDYVNTSLTKMAYGGIYDQIGGGFSRYATDSKWHIPHFEKMLYDNGQMLSLYSEAYAATKNELYKNVVFETASFLERELLDKSGAFYSSLDADSKNADEELKEGAFYSWTKTELKTLIKSDFDLFADYYNINNYGKWEENNYVLIRDKSDSEIAKSHKISKKKLNEKVKQWQKLLLEKREKRSRPRLDDKSLTSWNALTLKGYITAYKVFDDNHFLEIAEKNAHFILTKMLKPDGGLFRNYKNGKSNIDGYLEDYANVASAFIDLYQVTLDQKWLQLAKQLTDYSFDHFFDENSQMFYFTSNTSPSLVSKKIETDDNVIPSSNATTALNLFKLYHYYSNSKYLDVAIQMLHNVKDRSITYGAGASNWLILYSNYLEKYYEIAIVGPKADVFTQAFNKIYLPNTLIAASKTDSDLPLLESRFSENQTRIYICVDGACKRPVSTVDEALKLLNFKK